MRRALGLLVAVFMVVSVMPSAVGRSPAVAQAGPHRWVVTPGTLVTTTGPTDAQIPVTLDYSIYVPDNATALTPQPAMVLAHGFGNSKEAAELRTLAAFFASQGYVTLTSTHMGFGGSSGCISLDIVDYDARNVSSLIDLLAARPDTLTDAAGDVVVGMVGGSYGGGHQAGVAAIDNRLDAMSPGRTWNSLQYSLVPNNLVGGSMWDIDDYEQGVFKRGWTSLFYALGSTQPLMGGGGCDPATQQTLYPGQPPCPGFDPRVCPIFASLAATGDTTVEQRDFIGGAAAANLVSQVDIPVLLTQGESDTLFNLTEAIATYQALDARGVDVQMIFNAGGHGYQPRPGEGEPYAGSFDETDQQQEIFGRTYLAQRLLAFFDRHLRGQADDSPRVAYFRDWVAYDVEQTQGTAAPAYGSAAGYPIGGVASFHLDAASAALTQDVEAPEASSASLINPPGGAPAAHSETPNFSDEGQPGATVPPMELPGQNLSFDSAPLNGPVDAVGTGTVYLDVANANGRDAVLFAKVYDVDPDGEAILIRRLVTAARIPADRLPGRALIRLPGIVHRFQTGHRIRLVLATTDDSYGNAAAPDQITLSTGGDSASILNLPALSGPVIDRIAGPDRIQTAVQLSRRAFDAADTAVIASAGDFPDALAAGGLAATAEGPLLLAGADGVRADVTDELDRLGVQRVYLVGGTASLPAAVAADLSRYEVLRLAGPDRFATAAAVAEETARLGGGIQGVILARGDDFADALAAGSVSAQGFPVLLTSTDVLPAATRQVIDTLDPDRVLIAGGTAAVSDQVVDSLGRPNQRLAGTTRYETAALMVQEALRLRGSSGTGTILLASGHGFADALAAAPASQALGGVLMIVHPTDLSASPPAIAVLATGWQRAFLVGGYAALEQPLDGQIGIAVSQPPTRAP
ncbi:MAG: cell wall-binding repeat-containing protein [Euzebya sp.]